MPRIYPEKSVLTRGGRYFDLLDPRSDDVSITDIAHSLAHQCRFNGHTRDYYSVAQHCVLCSQLVAETHPELALEALLHDAAEAYLGDIASPLKSMLPAVEVIEAAIMEAICESFEVAWPLAPEVGIADRMMLAWERRDLMTEHQAVWEATLGVDLSNLPRIVCWQPEEAAQKFLQRFDALYMPAMTSRERRAAA
jgi:hypothetical protein